MIITVDLGTTLTKVVLWDHDGPVARSGVPVETVHPAPGWAEQDPSSWWESVVAACAEVRSRAGRRLGSVDAIGCTGARQTFAPVDAGGRPLGAAVVWSDRRAGAEAGRLAEAFGGQDRALARTGVPIEAGSVAAKIAWLADHDGGRLSACSWLLSPRDLVAWRLTGEVVTDPTMASRSGLFDLDGRVVEELAGPATAKLAPVVPSGQVSGRLGGPAADALGLAAGTPVVIGAGDRPCEVLGTAAGESCPMVSWGTTANVSLPSAERPVRSPPGMVLSRAADDGWLVEGGLSAAGSFLDWLGRITGRPPGALAELAAEGRPGARGVTAAPWLDGARAPWWEPEAGAAFVGLSSGHELSDLARAVFEAVGWEVLRCLEAMTARQPPPPPITGLALGGAGAAVPVWVEVVTGISGLPAVRRRSGLAASAGAALLASSAVDAGFVLGRMDPVEARLAPHPEVVARYAGLRGEADRVAAAVIGRNRPGPSAAPEVSACG